MNYNDFEKKLKSGLDEKAKSKLEDLVDDYATSSKATVDTDDIKKD